MDEATPTQVEECSRDEEVEDFEEMPSLIIPNEPNAQLSEIIAAEEKKVRQSEDSPLNAPGIETAEEEQEVNIENFSTNPSLAQQGKVDYTFSDDAIIIPNSSTEEILKDSDYDSTCVEEETNNTDSDKDNNDLKSLIEEKSAEIVNESEADDATVGSTEKVPNGNDSVAENKMIPSCNVSDPVKDHTNKPADISCADDGVISQGEENTQGDLCEKEKDTSKVVEETKKVDEWMDILGNGLLMKKVIKAGEAQSRPTQGQEITLKSCGKLENGTPVDCYDQITFILGEGDVIQAWDICVTLMEAGEICELCSDSKYCYSTFGRPDNEPAIPPDTNITYELELLCVSDGPDIETMTDEQRTTLGDKKKCHGNILYSRGDYSGSINVYTRALKYLEPSAAEDVMNLKVICWNNLAAAQLKIKAYQAAENSCLQVLSLEPDNVKALFRRGKVLALQDKCDEAMVYLKKAKALDPSNKTVTNELNLLKKKHASQLKKEKDMYQRMVGGLAENTSENKTTKSSILSWPMLFGATVIAIGGIVAALLINKH